MHNISQVAVPALLIVLMIYRRVKRSIGFQKFSYGRLQFRVVLFAVIGLLLLWVSFLHPMLLLADAAGIVCGAALAVLAIRHCMFERRGGDLYYRTHIGIETAVLAVFLGRIAYRLLFVLTAATNGQAQAAAGQAQMQQYTKDPWTLAIFFLLVAYYIGYFVYLMREGKKQAAQSRVR